MLPGGYRECGLLPSNEVPTAGSTSWSSGLASGPMGRGPAVLVPVLRGCQMWAGSELQIEFLWFWIIVEYNLNLATLTSSNYAWVIPLAGRNISKKEVLHRDMQKYKKDKKQTVFQANMVPSVCLKWWLMFTL